MKMIKREKKKTKAKKMAKNKLDYYFLLNIIIYKRWI